MRGHKRLWCVAVLSLLVGCASATQGSADAGVDLATGTCDPKTLFTSCSDQCHEAVCIVATAMCSGGNWVCDCNQVGPCKDLSPSD